VLGGAYTNLGLPERAVPLLQRSIDLRRATFGDRSEEVAEALLHLTDHHRLFRSFDDALPPAEEALDILTALHGADHPEAIPGYISLAPVMREMGQTDSAIALLTKALRISRATFDSASLEQTRLTLNLAPLLRASDRLDEAEALYREGIPRLRDNPVQPPLELAPHLNNLGYLLRVRGDYVGADSLYREAFVISTEWYGRNHPTTMMLAGNLAGVLTLAARHDESIEILEANLDAAREQFGDPHWRVGGAFSTLGFAHVQAGKIERAESPLRRVMAVYEETLGPEHEWTVFARAHLTAQQVAAGMQPDREPLDRAYDMAAGWAPYGFTSSGVGLIRRAINLFVLVPLNEEVKRFRALLPEG
jgi:tetratricopeptide (TPR) repeat protein